MSHRWFARSHVHNSRCLHTHKHCYLISSKTYTFTNVLAAICLTNAILEDLFPGNRCLDGHCGWKSLGVLADLRYIVGQNGM